MKFLDLKDIAERDMELVNPTSAEKVLTVGRALGLNAASRVLDLGSGYAEMLRLWAEAFGISGDGVELRPLACERARRKLAERGLAERIQIHCQSAADYTFPPHSYDVATCLGASFVWGGYGPAVRHLRTAIHPGGHVVMGEPYWRTTHIPPDYARAEATVHTEYELLQLSRQAGLDLVTVVRASHDDWDRYESGNWAGLLRWLGANPAHPERDQVLDHLRGSQDEYTRLAREYFGWAMLILTPTAA